MSISPEIMKRYLRLPTAQEIWSALSKAFYDGSDELQVHFESKRPSLPNKAVGLFLNIMER